MNEELDLEKQLADEESQLRRQLLVKSLGGRTHLTIGQIGKLLTSQTHGNLVATITLQELLDAPKDAPEPVVKKRKKKAKKAPERATKPPSTKREPSPDSGSDDTQALVRTAIEDAEGAPVALSDIQEATSLGTGPLRKALKELVDAGKISIQGSGRWTKYVLA